MCNNIALPEPEVWVEQDEPSPFGHPVKAKLVADEGEAYHERDELSHSEFKLFVDNPEQFERVVLTREEKLAFSSATVQSMDFGNKVEFALMHNRLPGNPVLIPREVLSKRKRAAKWYDDNHVEYDEENPEHHVFAKSGKAWKAFEAEHDGDWLIHPDDWDREVTPIARACDQVKQHVKARGLLFGGGVNHLAIVFACPFTGILLRCQLDWLSFTRYVVDLKTARDVTPKGFSTNAFNLGYHIQAAWYRYAVYSLIGENLPWVFVAVKNKAPFNVETFKASESFLQLGWDEWRENMLAIERSMKEGSFRTLTHGQLVELDPPFWAKPRTEFNKGF